MEAIVILALVLGSLTLLIGISVCIFGFRPVGVAAGSCAACCQSAIGNVVKGSCFALMTCLAMRGCFIALISIGVLVLAAVGIYLLINSEWFYSACAWVSSIPSSVSLKASSITVREQLRYAYDLARNATFSLSNGGNITKGFLQL